MSTAVSIKAGKSPVRGSRPGPRLLRPWWLLFLTLPRLADGAEEAPRPRTVLLIAGKKSHGPGHHEYEKGVELLRRCLEGSPNLKGVHVETAAGGWPEDPRALERADTVFLFCDGSDRDERAHPLLHGDRLEALGRAMRRGAGLVLLHYALFVPSKRGGEELLEWVGGYFDYENGPPAGERRWLSKITTCTAQVTPCGAPAAAPAHPVCRGLRPFRLREEFYHTMRFREGDPRRAAILTVPIPGEKEPQVVAWAVERTGGGRGFALTGGHFHDNWQVEEFRKLVLNALAWTAGLEVPEGGVESPPPEAPPARESEKAKRAAALPPPGRFGLALDAREEPLEVPGRDEFRSPPLTVECWARLRAKEDFNVLVACDPKHSSSHWEIYSYAGSGFFSAYLPGFTPAEVVSTRDVADDRWHHLAMRWDGRRVLLHVDGALEVDREVKPAGPLERVPGVLTLGAAVDRAAWVGCHGLLDEVRVSRGLRPTGPAPGESLEADADTLALWRFEGAGEERREDSAAGGLRARTFTPPGEPPPSQRWREMDTGPFLASTVVFPGSRLPPTMKAVTIRLLEAGRLEQAGRLEPGEASLCFDTELLRMSAGWTGGFLRFNAARDGLAGPPAPEGEIAFTTPASPGVSADGSAEDPRPRRLGPLPEDRGRWRGLHLHKSRVVLSYTAVGRQVLELPGLERRRGPGPGITAFTRTLEVGPGPGPLRVVLAGGEGPEARVEEPGALAETATPGGRTVAAALIPAGAGGVPAGAARLEARGASIILSLSPASSPVRLKVLLARLEEGGREAWRSFAGASPPPEELEPLTRGGPARWPEALRTRGVLGSGTGPFVVDTLTAPYENPWKAMLFLSGHDFLPDGNAAVCSVHGDVWIVSGIDAGLGELSWRRFAAGLFQPLGLRVRQGVIHVLGRDGITRLHDLDGDGEADFHEAFNRDCQVTDHGHEYATCLETDSEGSFYYTKCTNEGRSDHDGCLLRVSPDGRRLEVFATGFRNPNGMSIGPGDAITDADQEGTWMPATRLDLVRRGGFYGYMPAHHRPEPPSTYDLPLCWIPHEVDNSAGGQAWVEGGRWGLREGQLLHFSYGRCQAFLVLREEVEGVAQGGVVRLPVQFASGVMRGRFRSQDGQLYTTGLRGWQTSGVLEGALERVRFTGGELHLPVSLNVHANGVRIGFSDPLDPGWAADRDSYSVEVWGYRWTKEYGSRDWSVRDPARQGHDTVEVRGATVSGDGREVFLELAEVRPVMQMRIRYRLRAADRSRVSGDLHNTIHRLRPPFTAFPEGPRPAGSR